MLLCYVIALLSYVITVSSSHRVMLCCVMLYCVIAVLCYVVTVLRCYCALSYRVAELAENHHCLLTANIDAARENNDLPPAQQGGGGAQIVPALNLPTMPNLQPLFRAVTKLPADGNLAIPGTRNLQLRVGLVVVERRIPGS